MVTTYSEKLLEQGLLHGKRSTVLRLMKGKFGSLPASTQRRVEAIQSPEELDDLVDRVLAADSLRVLGMGRPPAKSKGCPESSYFTLNRSSPSPKKSACLGANPSIALMGW